MPTYAQIKSPYRAQVAQYVREVLKKEEITQQELSDRLEVSVKSIGTWSLGLSQPSIVSCIQKAVGCNSEFKRRFYTGMLRAMSDQITSTLIMLEGKGTVQ